MPIPRTAIQSEPEGVWTTGARWWGVLFLDIPECGFPQGESRLHSAALWPRDGSGGGGMAWGIAKAPSYLHLSFRGAGKRRTNVPNQPAPARKETMLARRYGTASRQLGEVTHVPAQVALWLVVTTLEPCTASSRQLSEVKHAPAAPGIEAGTSAFSLPSSFCVVSEAKKKRFFYGARSIIL